MITDGRAILHASSNELNQWMKMGFKVRMRNFGKNLLCFSPTAYPYKILDHLQSNPHNFISLSVTGISCSLRCEHCDGNLLKGMEPVHRPEDLIFKCQQVKSRGGEGVLIRGGSDSHGHVPLKGYSDAIKSVKTDLGLKVVVHTGLLDEETVLLMKDAEVDAVMLDIIGDANVSKKVYHIKDGPRKMDRSLELLQEYRVPAVPHVLVGLNYGSIGGEVEALEIISHRNPAAVVIIALVPIRKTSMEKITSPSPETVARIMTIARLGLENTPILLGCARPKGSHKIQSDKYAIECGMNGIALISQDGVNYARKMNLIPIFNDVCCSLAYQMMS